MFILLDTDFEGLKPIREALDALDDRTVVGTVPADAPDPEPVQYVPGGDQHVISLVNDFDSITRWQQLVFASWGVRAYTDKLNEDSPLWAGPIPAPDKIRKIFVDGTNAETRAAYLASFGVNYIGRTKLDPRNLFVLDNKKGNPLHDPDKDETLEALYASLPDDWWGSCGFVSTGNPDKLKDFLEIQENAIPITWTDGGKAKLRHAERKFVLADVPNSSQEYGVQIRDAANRLSYDLSFK